MGFLCVIFILISLMGFKYISYYLFLFSYVVIFNEEKENVWKVLFLGENVYYCTETVLLLKRGFHHRLSRELVNDQSSVSSCNQTSGSHAKQRQTRGGLYFVDSGVKVYV